MRDSSCLPCAVRQAFLMRPKRVTHIFLSPVYPQVLGSFTLQAEVPEHYVGSGPGLKLFDLL